MANDTYQQASASKKDINYTGKDFNSFRKNLIEYSKSYYEILMHIRKCLVLLRIRIPTRTVKVSDMQKIYPDINAEILNDY